MALRAVHTRLLPHKRDATRRRAGPPEGHGSGSNSLQNSAREYDPTLGKVYDRTRFYDPTSDGGYRFSWDPMSGGCAYTYAPTGERVNDTCQTGQVSVYDSAGGPSNLVAQYTTPGALQARYLQADGVDTPIRMVTSSGTYAYATDALGSVNRLTDANGNTVETYAYDPWGATSASGIVTNPFQFTGRTLDSSGLYDDRARSYDPTEAGAHRFLSPDPLGGGYAYVGDSPANFVDPSGMSRCTRYCGRQGSWDGTSDPVARCTRYCGHNGAGGLGSGGSSGGGGDGGGNGGVNGQWTAKCAVDWAIFGVAALISLLGINVDYASLRGVAVLIAGSFGPDIYGIFSFATPVSLIIAIFQFLFDIASVVWDDLIVSAVQGFFEMIQVGLEWGALFIPGELMVRLGVWLVSQFLAVGSLTAEGCLRPT